MLLRTVLSWEYRSDALMTVIRFILCLLPYVLFWTAMFNTFPRIEMNAGDEPDPEYLIAVSRIQILNTAWFVGGVFVFAIVQMSSRGLYFTDKNKRELFLWQALHGWNGSAKGAVYRPLVPWTEWGLLALTCLLTIRLTGQWWIWIPAAWVIARLLLLTGAYAGHTREASPELFYGCAGAWFLVGAYCLTPNNLLGLLPLSLLIGLHLKLDSTMRRRQIQAWNEQSESLLTQAPKVHLQDSESLHRKFIAELLSPKVRDWRPDWPTTLTTASVWAWLVCTVVWSAESHSLQYGSPEELPGNDRPNRFDGMSLIITLIVYLVIYMVMSGNWHWQPRHGLLARLRAGRLIVPSYDRIFLPIIICMGMLYIYMHLPDSVRVLSMIWLGITQAALVIVLLKAPPSSPEFQMTADAKLSKSFYQAR